MNAVEQVARHAGALWRDASGCAVVLVPGQESPRRLNGLAYSIWVALDQPATTAELLISLREAGTPVSDAGLADAIAALRRAGVLQ